MNGELLKKEMSRTQIEEKIKEFFNDKKFKEKNPREIKKIKRLAMSKNIPLSDFKKLFCKYCLKPYSGAEKVRIKNKIKTIECSNCKKRNSLKLKD
jgi:RNase P subunit RPR2